MNKTLKKNNFVRTLVIALLSAFMFTTTINGTVSAADGGGGGSGGGDNACGNAIDTCFGATWKWYPLDPNGGDVVIPGTRAGHYAQGGVIPAACRKYGGYWRYAMVLKYTFNPFGLGTMPMCSQVGLLGINRNSDPVFNSEMMGGPTAYIPKNGTCGNGLLEWEEVRQLYEQLSRSNPGDFRVGWGGIDPATGGGLSWFCGPPTLGSRVVYNYYLDNQGCYGRGVSYTLDNSISVTDDDKDGRVDIANNFALYQSRGYTFNGYTIGDSAGNPQLISSGPLYDTVGVAEGQVYTVDVHFAKRETEGCPCSDWVPDSYVRSDEHRGWSSVTVGVKNDSLSNDSMNEWHHMTNENQKLLTGPVYAKPTDNVQWRYCYFPGAQFAADSEVTQFNNHPEPNNNTTLTNLPFKNAYGWESKVHVWTENLKPGSENVDKIVSRTPGAEMNASQALPVEATMPENNRFYGVQPRNQPTPFTQNPTVELDPGWTLHGNIQTYGHTPTYAERDDGANHSWRCQPYTCNCNEYGCSTCWNTCIHTNPFFRNNQGDYSVKSDIADVIVPYNFKNRATATIKADSDDDPDNDVLYAGENVTVSNPVVTVDKRNNTLTQGDLNDGYSTQVDNGKARLIAFLSEEDVERKHFTWNGVSDDDGYGNVAPEGGKIWRSSSDNPCGAVVSKFGVCEYLESYDNITLNANSNLNGESRALSGNVAQSVDYFNQEGKSVTGKYNVFDEAAGNYFCVAAAIYPFSVKSNTDTDKDGDRSWYVSTPSCVKIAKRPTFQVWGAGVYSRRGTEISTENVKNNLLGNENDQNQNDQNRITRGAVRNSDNYSYWSATGGTNSYFGSWSELTATIGGRNEHLASGASLGYQALGGRNGLARIDSSTSSNITANLGTAFGNPGGTQRLNNLCLRSPLTIPNSTCKSSYTGNSSGSSVINGISDTIKNDVQALINRFGDGTGTASTPEEDEARPYKVEPAAEIGDKTIGKGETIVNIINGPITIKGNITYATDGYTSSNEIPKYIIYARGSNGNVTVDCNVNRIDAIIIADKEFNSCNDEAHSDKTNEQKNTAIRSHQLVINGALVAGTVTLNRSFGANSGGNSIVPAELINYDSTIYLWAHRMASASVSGQLTESASRELAPRY